MALMIPVLNTPIAIGDMIRLSQKIKEGEKERIQNFEGVVIAIKGNQGERTITVRRIGAGAIGIEKIIPVDLPSLTAVKVIKHSKVRRGKLYFLRERTGKEALQLDDVVVKPVAGPLAKPEKAVTDVKPSEKRHSKSSRKPRGAKSTRVSRRKKTV